ncbi:MAG: DHH family phosphoesterase, partial [Myxococcota bacterium]
MEPSPDMPRIAPAAETPESDEEKRKTKGSKLHAILDGHRGERHVIAIRGYPDPDSIACAMAHGFICQTFDIEPVILYFDDISHHENRALVKKLNIEMVRYGEAELADFDRIALVDAQMLELPPELEDVPMVSIVDHHKPQGEVTADFIDIREDAGSASSIYAEYLADEIVPLERENPFTGKLASALLY